MQIQMRNVSDIGVIDRAFVPYDDTELRGYIRDRYEKTMDYLERTSTSAGRAFLDRTREIFESVNSSEALRRTRAAIRSFAGVRNANLIHQVRDLDDLRSVGVNMQRFLMADTAIRARYHRQQCDGYSDTYVDVHKGDIGVDHYDYRLVNNGVFRVEKDETGEEVMVREVYYERLIDGDRQLDFIEQSDILDAQELQRMIFEAGYDSTNRIGAALG